MSLCGRFWGLTPGLIFRLEAQAAETGVEVIAAQVPYKLEDSTLPTLPASKYAVSFFAEFTAISDEAIAGLSAALKVDHIVDVDVKGDVNNMDAVWEGLEDLLTKATASLPGPATGAIVLSTLHHYNLSDERLIV